MGRSSAVLSRTSAIPSVPLIKSVPTPLMARRHYSAAGRYAEGGASEGAAARYAALSSVAGAHAQASLRLLIADMMLGLQEEHASRANFASASALQ